MAERMGLIYVELDLDASKFEKGQQKLLRESKDTALSVERSWQILGQKSDAIYQAMANRAIMAYNSIANNAKTSAAEQFRAQSAMVAKINALNIQAAKNPLYETLGIKSVKMIEAQKAAVISSYNTIKNSGTATAQDLVNIERAKNAKLKQLNKEMLGEHEKNYAAMARAVLRLYAAYYVLSQGARVVTDTIMGGIKAIDELKVSTIAVAAQLTTMQGPKNVMENYRQSLAYAEQLNLKLMDIDATSFANYQQIQLMNRAMNLQGVILDTNNKKQVESFTALTNAVAMFTQGQDKQKQASQEIRALMTGEVRAGNMLAMAINEQIKRLGQYKGGLKEVVALGKQHGDTLERLQPYLVGIVAASGDIQQTWESVSASFETAWGIIQRAVFKDIYKEITISGRKFTDSMRENADEIAGKIKEVYGIFMFSIKSTIALLALFKAASIATATSSASAFDKAFQLAATRVTLHISTITLALSSLGSAITGFSIGTYLSNEFELVRQLGVNAVYNIIEAWEWLQHQIKMGSLELQKMLAPDESTWWGQYRKKVRENMKAAGGDITKDLEIQTKASIEAQIEAEKKGYAERKVNLTEWRVEQLAEVSDAGVEQAKAAAEAAKKALLKGITISKGEAAEVTRELFDEIAQANKDNYWNAILGAQDEIQKEMERTGYTYDHIINEMVNGTYEWGKKTEKEAKKATKELEAETTKIGEFWEHTIDNMHDTTANFFYNLLNDAKITFDGIKEWFLRLLSEMAAQAVTGKIVIPVAVSVGSSLGISNIAEGSSSSTGMGIPGMGSYFSEGSWMGSFVNSSFGTLPKVTGVVPGVEGSQVYGAGGSGGSLSSWGTTWGNIASYAGIALNAINMVQEFDKGNYGTGVGTALGTGVGAFFGGPIGAAIGGSIGSMAGGIVDSIFGGSNAGFGTFSHTATGTGKWGGYADVGSWFQAPRGSGNAPAELLEGFSTGIKGAIDATYSAVASFAEMLPSSVGSAFEQSLQGLNVQFLKELSGVVAKNASGGFDIAITRETASLLEGYINDLPAYILSQISPQIETAVIDWMGTIDVSKLSAESKLMAQYQQILSGLTEGFGDSIEDFTSAATGFAEIMNQLTEAEKGYREQVENFLNPMSAVGTQLREINEYFEGLVDTLTQVGYTTAALSSVMEDWAKITDKIKLDAWTEIETRWKVQNGLISDTEQTIESLNKQYMEDLKSLEAIYGDNWTHAITVYTMLVNEARVADKTVRDYIASSSYSDKDLLLMLTEFGEKILWLKDQLETSIDSVTEEIKNSTIDARKAIRDLWSDVISDLEDKINDMRYSTDNPADAIERLGLLKGDITALTGGNASAYIAGFATAEERAGAVQELSDMWSQYLSLAQEAYQRPSIEYQAIYKDVLNEFTMLKTLATGYKTQEEILLDQLGVMTDIKDLIESATTVGLPILMPTEIPMPSWVPAYLPPAPEEVVTPIYTSRYRASEGVTPIDSYASGTNYVPQTGLYQLHKGESVIPVGGGDVMFNLSVNIDGSKSPQETAVAVKKEVEGFVVSNRGRKLIQEAARGR